MLTSEDRQQINAHSRREREIDVLLVTTVLSQGLPGKTQHQKLATVLGSFEE